MGRDGGDEGSAFGVAGGGTSRKGRSRRKRVLNGGEGRRDCGSARGRRGCRVTVFLRLCGSGLSEAQGWRDRRGGIERVRGRRRGRGRRRDGGIRATGIA